MAAGADAGADAVATAAAGGAEPAAAAAEAVVVPGMEAGAAQRLVWGIGPVSDDILARWRQGFVFAAEEPSALAQRQGGPCGVLAPVQAHLLRQLLFPPAPHREASDWRRPPDILNRLVRAMADILTTAAAGTGSPPQLAVLSEPAIDTYEAMHASVRFHVHATREELEAALTRSFAHYEGGFGVVLFLYSCVASRGAEAVTQDLGLDIEPLISAPFGHANQSLINLLLFGRATPNVFDGDKDAGGMVLRGVSEQSPVGYLTLIEALKYCTVGSFLKSPKLPIWVLGSETHMTVLFSLSTALACEESAGTKAARVFDELDSDGNGFIMPEKLAEGLERLGLDHTPEAVEAMRQKTDVNQLGILLKTGFLEALFPQGMPSSETPSSFVVYHYNGLPKPSQELQYVRGLAKTAAPRDFGSPQIMQCLRTKWKELQIEWQADQPPSIT